MNCPKCGMPIWTPLGVAPDKCSHCLQPLPVVVITTSSTTTSEEASK